MLTHLNRGTFKLLQHNRYFIISRKNAPNDETTPKPNKPKSAKKQIKVSKLKVNEELGGYRIYQSNESKSFMYVSLAISMAVSASGFMLYLAPTVANALGFCMMGGSLYYHQSRLRKTVKEMLVDKLGTNVRVRKYGLFGTNMFGSYVEIPVHILQGVRTRSYKRGLVVVGGGLYGYDKIMLQFTMAGILDKPVFTAVTAGTPITYADIL